MIQRIGSALHHIILVWDWRVWFKECIGGLLFFLIGVISNVLLVCMFLIVQFLLALLSKLVHVSFNPFLDYVVNQVTDLVPQIVRDLVKLQIIFFLFVTLNMLQLSLLGLLIGQLSESLLLIFR